MLNLWAAQVASLQASRISRVQPACYANIRAAPAGQALKREEEILRLLRENGPQIVGWIANRMGWSIAGTRRRLNQMLDKGTVVAKPTWPRSWAVAEGNKRGTP